MMKGGGSIPWKAKGDLTAWVSAREFFFIRRIFGVRWRRQLAEINGFSQPGAENKTFIFSGPFIVGAKMALGRVDLSDSETKRDLVIGASLTRKARSTGSNEWR